jgi:hypothetical protein
MFSSVDLEIRPEPGLAERQAIIVALAELLDPGLSPSPHRSAWRVEGIRENVEELTDEDGSR